MSEAPPQIERLADGLRKAPIPDERCASLADLSDEELRDGIRRWIEPGIKEALAHVRPN